jgi:molecular chaperone GrpE
MPDDEEKSDDGREASGTSAGESPADGRSEALSGDEASPEREMGELARVLRERDEFKDRYLRALAEVDNQRKRAERDKRDHFQFALAETLKDILGVADSMERALGHEGDAEEEVFREGVRRIHKQLLDVLSKKGVTPILDVVGKKFDPNIHQALATEESEEAREPRVAEELQRGYRIHGRLLRPSLVRVVVPGKKHQR